VRACFGSWRGRDAGDCGWRQGAEEEAVFNGHSDDERRSIRPQEPRPSGLPAGPGRLRR
jgi:hypothetical protein